PIMMHENSHLYNLHEMHYAALSSINMMAGASKAMLRHPLSPLSYTGYGRSAAAAAEVVERVTHRYGKPLFGIKQTKVDGKTVAISEEIIAQKAFCDLLHFKKDSNHQQPS